MVPQHSGVARRPLTDLLMGEACGALDRLLADDAGNDTMHDEPGRTDEGELHGLHVLLVDDCADALVPLALLLELCGAEVATASDGPQALARIEQADAPFDVLVSDLRMPGMSGLELIRRVRDRPLPRQPVAIACTGYAGVGTREIIDAGFDALLAKPLEVDALERAIVSLCAARAPFGARAGLA